MTPRPRTAAVAAALVTAVLLGAGCGRDDGNAEGQTRMTLAVSMPDGGPPTEAALTAARGIIADRFSDAGLPEPTVGIEADRMVVTVRERVDHDRLRWLLVPGELQFRKALASAEASGSAGGEPPAGDPSGTGQPPTRAEVTEKVGEDAMSAAGELLDLVEAARPPEVPEELADAVAPFADLAGPEVAALPTALQFYLPTVGCGQLATRPAETTADPDHLVAACDEAGATKYLLDTAQVRRPDVADATADSQPQTGQWAITLQFTSDAQQRWTELTREATQNDASTPFDVTALGNDGRYQGAVPIQCDDPDFANCLVAVLLDQHVITAPQIQEVINGPAVITGDFDREQASFLASVLHFDPLPLQVEVESVEDG